jgi:hypothetical protein
MALSGIYYFPNAFYADEAFSSNDVTYAIYHDTTATGAVENWNSAIVNASNFGNPNYYTDGSNNSFGWKVAYSDVDVSGTLASNGDWIRGGQVLEDFINANLLFLCPAFAPSAIAHMQPGAPSYSSIVPIAIGVLSYNTGKTPITDTPDSITASGLTTGDGSSFYKTKYSSRGIWNVNVVINPGLIGGTTSIGTLITPGQLVDSTNVSSSFTANPVVYGVVQEAQAIVSVLSYYANQTDENTGRSNNDDLFGASGASAGRIAYCLDSTSGKTIGTIETGGYLGGVSSWNLVDLSGNAYSGNPRSNTTGIPFESQSWFLYPYVAPGPAAPCFLEGSQILCLVDEKETYLPIEQMRKGTLVKTLNSGYKMVHIIGKRDIPNFNDSARIKDRLYKLTSAQYPDLTSDLYLTGCHSTLVDSLTEEQKDEIKKMLGVVCVTEGKYRLPASVDQKAEPWQSKGTYTVWHFALDDEDPLINFGVYANGGLVVETGSIRYLQGKANMELV